MFDGYIITCARIISKRKIEDGLPKDISELQQKNKNIKTQSEYLSGDGLRQLRIYENREMSETGVWEN